MVTPKFGVASILCLNFYMKRVDCNPLITVDPLRVQRGLDNITHTFGGGREPLLKNKKVFWKFLPAAGHFFIVEVLKTVENCWNSKILRKTAKFWKRGSKNYSLRRAILFRKVFRSGGGDKIKFSRKLLLIYVCLDFAYGTCKAKRVLTSNPFETR